MSSTSLSGKSQKRVWEVSPDDIHRPTEVYITTHTVYSEETPPKPNPMIENGQTRAMGEGKKERGLGEVESEEALTVKVLHTNPNQSPRGETPSQESGETDGETMGAKRPQNELDDKGKRLPSRTWGRLLSEVHDLYENLFTKIMLTAEVDVPLSQNLGLPTWIILAKPKTKLSVGKRCSIRMPDDRISCHVFKIVGEHGTLGSKLVLRAKPNSTSSTILIITNYNDFTPPLSTRLSNILHKFFPKHKRVMERELETWGRGEA
ncbi:hypothetical protein BC835DRAFT_1414897 [Cytidiella melzeri]|nr:hypothetical protein BC835DRAFT_1414897 [Cytidiella melzeri]